MNTEEITLFPVTHEQTFPTFHIRNDLSEKFIAFLSGEDVKIVEPPHPVEGTEVTEILLEAGTPADRLETIKKRFLNSLAG